MPTLYSSQQLFPILYTMLETSGIKGNLNIPTKNMIDKLIESSYRKPEIIFNTYIITKVDRDSFSLEDYKEEITITQAASLPVEETDFNSQSYTKLFGNPMNINCKEITVKELKNSYAASAIAGEISKHFSAHKGFSPRDITANIILDIILGDHKAYLTSTGKLVFSYQDVLYLTERYTKVFKAKDIETYNMLQEHPDILNLILNNPNPWSVYILETIPEEFKYTKSNNTVWPSNRLDNITKDTITDSPTDDELFKNW